MEKRKGLQTDIKVIFSGVPVPGKNFKNSSAFVPVPKPKDAVPLNPPILKSVIHETKAFPVEVEESTSKSLKRDKPRSRLSATRQERVREVSSKRKKTSAVLAFVLSMTLISLLVRNFYASQENFFNPGIAVAEQAKTAISLKPVKINWPVPLVYPENLRDPMEPIKVKIPNISTGFIVSINNKLFVVIDRQLYSEGDIVEGTTIVKISSNYIEFRADEKNWKQKIPRLVVRGIVYSDGIPLAIVGIDIVKEGDIVMGVTVVKINQNSVEFEVGGRRWAQEAEKIEEKESR